MITQQTVATTEIVIGSISAIACLLVVLTYFIFKDIRCLRCVELSVYVALSDMLASIGLAIGAQTSYSVACTFQTFLTTWFYLSSAFWNVVITYQVYIVVIRRDKIIQNLTYFHIFCWIFPLFLTLMPLTTNGYGNDNYKSY